MSVSLCLMVWNEEEKLAACLQSAADLVGEAIVVDTGSTGSTGSTASRVRYKASPTDRSTFFTHSTAWQLEGCK